MVKAARTIKKRWQGILNWDYQQTAMEYLRVSTPSFRLQKLKARVYRRFDTIIAIFYMLSGKLDFSKINPYYATHSV
jgi:transposase